MPRPSLPIRRLVLAAIVLVIVVAGLLLAVSQSLHSTRTASTHALIAAARQSAKSTPSSPPIRDVLFVGASYTAGLGATPPTEGYAYVIGREPGWRTQVDGVSGTGFLNPGPHGDQTFAQRIAHLPTRPHPDMVVFQGGRNDVSFPSAQLRAAAIETASLTHKHFGDVKVVFLGPIPAHVPAPADQLAVAATLRSAAAAAKAVFIDPLEQEWITPANEGGYIGQVPAHPDNDGYAYIAKRLLADLSALYAGHGGV